MKRSPTKRQLNGYALALRRIFYVSSDIGVKLELIFSSFNFALIYAMRVGLIVISFFEGLLMFELVQQPIF